ncbi:MAG TPA: hypothetical protein VHX88_11140 [Solirubrobacteraceae bacterium]|nr:hypothetical protein [Solirubrobacteraceae bacterium]
MGITVAVHRLFTHRSFKARPVMSFIDRTFLVWAVAGLAAASAARSMPGLTGVLWAGAVRVLLLPHVTNRVNSICHAFGRRGLRATDESRNVSWLAPASFGGFWHNNRHASPTSARHGLGRWPVDPSALVIAGLERAGLAWDVVWIWPSRQGAAALSGPARAWHGPRLQPASILPRGAQRERGDRDHAEVATPRGAAVLASTW